MYDSIYDRFIQRQPSACVRASVNFFFKKKNFSSETNYWICTKFHRNVPLIEVKNFSSPLQKNQAFGTIQALKHL